MDPAGSARHSVGVVQNPPLQDSAWARVESVMRMVAMMGVGKRIVAVYLLDEKR
jgi:hypothetical protein